MYNEFLKSKLENPSHYDRMVFLIMLHNPSCENRDWALQVINTCITYVYAGEYGDDMATGMCVAIKTHDDKVRLFLEPIAQDMQRWEPLVKGI